MQPHHPFRFGAASIFTSPADWAETARKMEALGYSTILTSDHPGESGVDPISALVMAAAATTTLQLGTHVLANDFRNPVMLAQQVATLDVVSGERFQFGIGTGYNADDYAALGICLDSPGARVGRLEEAVTLIKRLFHEETVTFSGCYYTTHNARLNPKPTQHPHPPLFIGGGGKRILSLAGREADIVSFDPKGIATGPKDFVNRDTYRLSPTDRLGARGSGTTVRCVRTASVGVHGDHHRESHPGRRTDCRDVGSVATKHDDQCTDEC